MQEVYSRAEKVFIWLGHETPALRRSLYCIDLAADFGYLPVHLEQRTGPTIWNKLKLVLQVTPPYTTYKWITNTQRYSRLQQYYSHHDLDQLLNQEWFLRVWTFQEAILARDCVIVCGSTIMDWERFVRGFGCLDQILGAPGFLSAEGKVILHYGTLTDDNINTPEDARQSNLRLPHTFMPFHRVLNLWMRIDRSNSRRKILNQVEILTTIYGHQKPLVAICNIFLPTVPGFVIFSMLAPLACLFGGVICLYQWELPILICLPLVIISVVSATLGWIICVVMDPMETSNMHKASARPKLLPIGLTGESKSKRENPTADILLEGIVHTMRQRRATDPKDKSYAMYSVLENAIPNLHRPDYEKSRGQIYHELLLDLLEWSPVAMILLLDAGVSPRRVEDMR